MCDYRKTARVVIYFSHLEIPFHFVDERVLCRLRTFNDLIVCYDWSSRSSSPTDKLRPDGKTMETRRRLSNNIRPGASIQTIKRNKAWQSLDADKSTGVFYHRNNDQKAIAWFNKT